MATLSKGKTFGETEEVSATDLHDLVDKGSISGIIAADISDNVITDAKMVSVSGAKLISLSGIPSGSGVIPAANLTSVAQKGANSDITSLSGLTTPLSVAQGGTGETASPLPLAKGGTNAITAAAAFTNIVVPKSYASGWTAIPSGTNGTSVLTHSLGTLKVLAVLYGATSNVGANMSEISNSANDYATVITTITTTQITVINRGDASGGFIWNGSAWVNPTFFRVVMLALE